MCVNQKSLNHPSLTWRMSIIVRLPIKVYMSFKSAPVHQNIMLQYYAPVLHFKLKYKKLSRSIYNVQNPQMLWNWGLEVRIHKTLSPWKLSVNSTCTHPRSSALIREQDNCWNRCNCRSVSAPLSVFWSPNQPPPMTPSHKSFRQPWCDFLTKAHSLSRCTRARYKKGQRQSLREDRRRNGFLL